MTETKATVVPHWGHAPDCVNGAVLVPVAVREPQVERG